MSTRVTNIFELYAKLNLGMYPVARDDPEYPAHKNAWAAVGVDIEAPPPPPVDLVEREMFRLMFRLIASEVARARHLMPGRSDMFVALTEEVGELAQALIDQKYKAPSHLEVLGEARAKDLANNQVLKEAVQVAAMAVRIAMEGDAGFVYEPPAEIQYADRQDCPDCGALSVPLSKHTCPFQIQQVTERVRLPKKKP